MPVQQLSRPVMRRTPRADSDGTLSLFVFIDALGWEVVRRHPWFLAGLADTRGPLNTVLGYSCTCDPTILTGRLPREHGHFSFYRFDPESSPFRHFRHLRVIPSSLRDRGRVRHWISRATASLLGYTGYFQLYGVPFEALPFLDYTEKRDLYAPGGIIGGQATVFDHFRAGGVDFHCSDWRKSEVHNLARASASIADGRPRSLYLYLAGLDGVMHASGPRSHQATAKLRYYDRALRSLVADAQRRYAEVRLHIFSDHGMTDVIGTSALRRNVEALGLRYGHDYAAVYDSTLARFWFPNPSVRGPILEVVEREKAGRVLSDVELAREGCDFPDHRYGELVFLLDPGYVFDPSFMGSWVPAGMHGYAPSHADSRAAYLCSHPPMALPQHLTDLFEVMLADCGVVA